MTHSSPAPPAPPPTRRRFAPVPIETTYERVRKGGPPTELTPEPSPRSVRSPSPRLWSQPREKRRFAPQLIESSRRCRRAGDVGPATKPADKTDITPHTNHIYAPRTRRRHHKVQSQARRESCDDEIAHHFLDLMAREAQTRRIEEVALAAFPNSGARAGGAEHFFVREGSDDDSNASWPPKTRILGASHSRRDSNQEDVGWAVREMQEHHDQLDKARRDPAAAQARAQAGRRPPLHPRPRPHDARRASRSPLVDHQTGPRRRRRRRRRNRRRLLLLLRPPSPPPTTTTTGSRTYPTSPCLPSARRAPPRPTAAPAPEGSSPPLRPIGETFMPYIPSAPPGKAADMPYVPASSLRLPPDTAFRRAGGPAHAAQAAHAAASFGVPFGTYAQRDLAADRDLHLLRSQANPPMAGQDLTFRTCPSPQQTLLEPDHAWEEARAADARRDPTAEEHGLWHGYCYSPRTDRLISPVDRPPMVATPAPLFSPADPFAAAFGTYPAQPTAGPSRLPTAPPSAPPLSPAAGPPSPSKLHHHHHQQQQQHHTTNNNNTTTTTTSSPRACTCCPWEASTSACVARRPRPSAKNTSPPSSPTPS